MTKEQGKWFEDRNWGIFLCFKCAVCGHEVREPGSKMAKEEMIELLVQHRGSCV
jgi:hypothetical protein